MVLVEILFGLRVFDWKNVVVSVVLKVLVYLLFIKFFNLNMRFWGFF